MPGLRARLLVTGDLHLGRTPARVPPGDRALGVEAVLRSLVDQALEREVDAVVLTGDLTDESENRFEAVGALDRALRRLVDAGIPVFTVAGSHNHGVLGALADALDAPLVRVLGRGQRWEAVPLVKDGREVLRLVGWSSTGAGNTGRPLDPFPDQETEVPVVGVVHADGNDPAFDVLREAGATAWLLGQSHPPRVERQEGRVVLRPGSLQPLGPDEPGPHGAWVVEVDEEGATATPLPIATVRYDRLAVDLDGAADGAEVRERVLEAVRAHAEAVRTEAPALRRLVVRLRLEGRTAAFRAVAAVAAEIRDAGDVPAAGLAVTVERVEEAARPALDLDRLATGSGPIASLAGLALRLDIGEPTESDAGLIRQSAEAVRAARRARAFEPLRAHGRLDDDGEAEAVRRLRRQTFRLLDQALAQLPSDGAPAAESPPAAAPAP